MVEKLHILVTGARGFLGRFVMAALSEQPDKVEVTTLGLSPHNELTENLATGVPTLPERQFDLVAHLVGGCADSFDSLNGVDFAALNVATTRNLLKALEKQPPRRFVYVSTTDVYGRAEGTDLGEGIIPDPQTEAARTKLEAEAIITEWCRAKGVECVILRCPAIVGTEMKGGLRRLVNSIWRGTYNHVADETAHLSVVHATDVARAILDRGIASGTYNLTDGVNPSLHDFVEALAHRMDDKRVMTMSAGRARIMARIGNILPITGINTRQLAARYTTLTFSAEKFLEAAGWRPVSVTEYLTSHQYDASDV